MNEEIIARIDSINTILAKDKALFRVQYDSVLRGNGFKNALILKSSLNAAPVVYTENRLWQETDKEIAKKLEEIFQSNACEINISEYLDPDRIKEKILPRASSAYCIPDLKKAGVTCIRHLDLAFTFAIPVETFSEKDNEEATIRVTDDLLSHAGMTREEAAYYAEKNMEHEVEFKSITSYVGEEEPSPLWVLSRKDHLYGAGVLISTKILQDAADALGAEKMMILPSSVHEVLCLKSGIVDPRDLYFTVTDINLREVSEEDKLTDNVYIFEDRKLTSFV